MRAYGNDFFRVAAFAGLVLAATACGDDNDETTNNAPANNATTNNTTGTNNTPGVEACTPYTPEEPSGMETITLATPTDRRDFTLTTPDGVGGGYWTVEATGVPDVSNFEFTVVRDDDGAEITEAGTGGDLGIDFRSAFVARPEATFTLSTGFTTPASVTDDDIPATYQLAWQFHPAVDCYEPNPTADDAPEVPLGEDLSAYLLPAFEDELPATRDVERDFYAFTVEEPGTYAAVATESPMSINLGFAIHDAAGTQLGYNFPQVGGGLPDVELTDLAPGTYFLEVTNRDASDVVVGGDTAVPDGWTTPYGFRIERR